MNRLRNKRGSLTVEAAIVLPFFICVVLSLGFFMRVVYTHTVMQYAITQTANEISTYSYLYSVSGLQKAHDGTQKYLDEKEARFADHLTSVIGVYDSLKSDKESIEGAVSNAKNLTISESDLSTVKTVLENRKADYDTLTSIYGDIKNDPNGLKYGVKKEIVSMVCLMANGAFQDVKTEVLELVVEQFMKKHFITANVDDPDKRLRMLNVVGGVEGLDFSESTLFRDRKTIDIIVNYTIEPIVPIKILPPIHMTQRVTVKAWLDGVGTIASTPTQANANIWDLPNAQRGIEAVKQLNGNVTSDTGSAVDRFDPKTGEAVNIRTIDLTAATYRKGSNLKSTIRSEVKAILEYTGKIGVEGEPGKQYDIKSRKVIIVVPKGTMSEAQKKAFDEVVAEMTKPPKNVTIELVELGEKKVDESNEPGKNEDKTGPPTPTPVPGACFTWDTLVLTKDGHRLIKDIKAGDEVYSINPETGEKGLKLAEEAFIRETSTLIYIHVSGKKINTTVEHPFWVVGKGWVEAAELKSGDQLLLYSGMEAKVERVATEKLHKPIKVYNFRVADWHTYLVTDYSILVHNNNECADTGAGKDEKGGANTANKIKPSNQPNPDAIPKGTKTKISPKADEATKRSLTRENEAAEILAKKGYEIEQNPKVEGTTRNPDYKLEGQLFDCYAPDKKTSVRSIGSTIEEKVITKKQADRIVLNLKDWNGNTNELVEQLNKYPIEGLKEVIVITKENEVISLYP